MRGIVKGIGAALLALAAFAMRAQVVTADFGKANPVEGVRSEGRCLLCSPGGGADCTLLCASQVEGELTVLLSGIESVVSVMRLADDLCSFRADRSVATVGNAVTFKGVGCWSVSVRRAAAKPVAAVSSEPDGEAFSVSRMFSANGVLPREVEVPVWGRGEPGADVSVEFAGQRVAGKIAADGTWQVALKPLAACAEGRPLVIVSGDRRIELADCLVGDVWLCGGQSNMEFRFDMGECDYAKYEAESVQYPAIRWMKIDRRASEEPQPYLFHYAWGGEASWTPASKAFGRLTCAGYYFARRIHRETGVPIGFIDAAWNGSRIEPFIPQFDADGRLAKAGKEGRSFNAMLTPLVKFPLRGVIWYQGCSNSGDGFAYADRQLQLVRGWRRAWGRELPFYYVQLSSLGEQGVDAKGRDRNPVGSGFAKVREGQRRFLKMADGTGMAVSIDVGDPKDVHAKSKKLVGDRLAQLALAGTYGRKIVPAGPNVTAAAVEAGGKVRLHFENVGGGLITCAKDWRNNDDPTPTPGARIEGFVVSGEPDGKGRTWHAAEAVVDGDCVVVGAAAVPAPKAVAYAHRANPMGACNLYNRELLPAAPFIIDVE